MRKANLVLILVLALAACGPAGGSAETISACRPTLDDLARLFSGVEVPSYFETENPVKQGGEFDAMEYFSVFDHLSMKPGYVLDYVYHYDGMGGHPILYFRPQEQPPYQSEADLPTTGDWSAYLDYIQAEDTPEGYFQFAVMEMVAGQFYLFWHAGYNDLQIVCDKTEVNKIVSDLSKDGFGLPMSLASRARAALLNEIEPQVVIGEQTVEVRIVTFSKWGGFFLTTETISRSAPHKILDVQQKNLVPYDCGIMF